ncbi:MAG: U32 family peptidase [Ruminococcaceae bacterium]|nr:U32 family peptidase [Oscillospiraceae bacterium]
MTSFEILAPVGAQEQLKAAVRSGANAVYLGVDNFNARRNADNFTTENLKDAVKYCHLRDVRVFVTLNTLIFDKEIDELYKTVKAIAESGADAIIVQDFATVKAVKEICPDMPLHASTQMAVHNVAGAKLLEEMGFSRIVLARELSLNEMKMIREAINAELEVFVHGAHCMSTSGNCYLSAMLGERSGNRGLCAQGCRLNWTNTHGREYALSLKDMSYLDNIKDLMKIGIDSFKIEGRMKRPEYVAAAVSSLKKAMNNEYYDKLTLRSVFSRSGFTDGYLKNKRTVDMFGYRVKEDVTSASTVLKELENSYKDEIRPNKASAKLILKKDEPATLLFSSKGASVTVKGEIPQEPRTSPLSEEIALRNLSKLGDTSFYLDSLGFENEDSLTLPASAINALRRDAANLLEEELANKEYKINAVTPNIPHNITNLSKPKTRIRLESFSQYSDAFEKADLLILPLEEALSNLEEIECLPVKIAVELPQLIYPEDEKETLKKLSAIKRTGIVRGVTGNIGGIAILKKAGFKVYGSHGLNITNSLSAKSYKDMGLEDVTLSFELSEKGIKNICADCTKGIYIYGYLPIMLLRNCPQKSENGCGKCNGKSVLTDRKGIEFPLLCQNKKYSVLHNSVPLYIGDKNLSNLNFVTFYFTVENKKECEKLYQAYLNGKSPEGKKTNGLYTRELL